MSKEQEVDWGLVAKKLISMLGVETARGLYYGLLSQALVPIVVEKVRDVAAGRAKEEEVKREILEILARQQISSAPAPQDLERTLAQLLQAQARGQTAYQYPGIQAPPTPPPALPPTPPRSQWIQEQIESMKREIATYENIRETLIKQKYTTFDEQQSRQIDERLREVDAKINDLRARLYQLMLQSA